MLTIDPEPGVIYGLLLQVSSKPATDFTLYIYLAAIVFLLVLSALVSGSEVSYFSLQKKELSNEAEKYKTVLHLLDKPKKLLATILILNNFINIGIVTLTTLFTAKLLHFESLNAVNGAIATTITLVTTFIIVFFGEVLPKVYANQNNKSFALKMSSALSVFNSFFTPFSWILINLTQVVERSIEKKTQTITKEDLNKAIELTTEENITKEEKDILKGIVNFGQINAKQIMRSRIDIAAFDTEMNFHDLMDKINKQSYSRYPVYEETIDSVKGVLFIKDLLPHVGKDENFKWQELVREVFFIPEFKKIDDLLNDFQQKRSHMAIVVDEYGGTSGVVTMEDVIEEIVGEINDEFDDDEINYTKLNNNSFLFEGKTSIHDFCKIVEIESEFFDEVKGENESLGGLMLELFSKIPRVSDKISYKNYTFTIQSVNTKRVKRIKVEVAEPQEENDAA